MRWFEGVCVTHVILTPGACGRVALSRGGWLTLAGKAGKPATGSEPAGPLFLTTLPSNMLNLAVHALPQSPPVASGGLWGRSDRHIVVFEGEKSPCGSATDTYRYFEGKKSPCGNAKDTYRYF